jgi:hypothetical protein
LAARRAEAVVDHARLTRARTAELAPSSIVLSLALAALGCGGPRAAVRAEAPAVGERGVAIAPAPDLDLRARVLDAAAAENVLGAELLVGGVVPVAFAVTNHQDATLVVERTDFRLFVDERPGIEPSLPGRAASLLRDTSGSRNAALLGAFSGSPASLVLLFLAVPTIDAAEDKETAADVAKREFIFDRLEIGPGATAAGYLVFETGHDPEDARRLVLELRSGTGADAISRRLELPNPYAD